MRTIKLGLLMAVAAFGLFFAFNTINSAKADDKKCESCTVVKEVVESMRNAKCDKCTKEKACSFCDGEHKKLEAKLACKDDKGGVACEKCVAVLKDAPNGCKHCAAAKWIVNQQWCCAKCEKAGNVCDKCEKARAEMTAMMPKCEKCSKVAPKK
jgi:hypothetical protein